MRKQEEEEEIRNDSPSSFSVEILQKLEIEQSDSKKI